MTSSPHPSEETEPAIVVAPRPLADAGRRRTRVDVRRLRDLCAGPHPRRVPPGAAARGGPRPHPVLRGGDDRVDPVRLRPGRDRRRDPRRPLRAAPDPARHGLRVRPPHRTHGARVELVVLRRAAAADGRGPRLRVEHGSDARGRDLAGPAAVAGRGPHAERPGCRLLRGRAGLVRHRPPRTRFLALDVRHRRGARTGRPGHPTPHSPVPVLDRGTGTNAYRASPLDHPTHPG